ncbi:MAG: protein kinase [Planctomycetes bacterium]|nr:protein kinase [Planctomycetota bacterium]
MNLIATEYELRLRSESDLSVDEFCERFPEFSSDLAERLVLAKNQSEYQTASVHAAGEETMVARVNRPELRGEAIVGTQLRDYRIIEKIGEGGMGAVYRAVHERLGKTVAVKVLSENVLKDQQAVARFQREMLAVGSLNHENIVTATDAGEANGRHFLVMEFVKGVDVSTIARERIQLPITEACEIIRQAAIGLQHVHENELVHRDIKPSNIMVSRSRSPSATSTATSGKATSSVRRPEPTVKLLDLGLARLNDPPNPGEDKELTTTGQIMGTFDYMAPEQTMGGDVDIRADIYSLGSTLYRLLCGRAPFSGEENSTPVQKIIALVQQEPKPIRELREDVPQKLAQIIDKMLAKEPSDRFQTPAEVADTLAAFTDGADLGVLLESSPHTQRDGDNIGQVTVADPHRSPRPKAEGVWLTRRRKLTIGALALSLVAVITAAVMVIRLQTPEGEWQLTMLEPGQEVTIRNGTEVVKKVVVTTKDDVVTLRVGKYEVVVKGANGVVVMEGTVEIRKDGRAVARLEKIAVGVALTGRGGPPSSMYALVTRPAKLDGIETWTLETIAPRGAIRDVKFNPAGDLFAVASEDGAVRLFKPDGTLERILIGHDSPVRAVAWSLKEKQLASVSGLHSQPCTIHIWDVTNGNLVNTVKVRCTTPPASIDWHRDGQRLAIGGFGGNVPCIWNLKAGRQVHRFKANKRTGTQCTLAWSHDGKLLAMGGVAGKQIDIMDGETYELLSTLPSEAVYSNFIWSPTERKLAFVEQNPTTFQIWAFDDPRKPRQVEAASTDRFYGLLTSGKSVWSPDGKTIAFGQFKTRCSVHLMNGDKVTSLSTKRDHDHSDAFYAATWKNHHLVTASSDGLRIWNMKTKQLSHHISCFGSTIQTVDLSYDGKVLAIYPLTIYGSGFIDLRSQKTSLDGIASRFVWSSTERRLVTNKSGMVKLHEYDDGTTHNLKELDIDVPSSVSLSPGDRLLATGDGETNLLWSDWRQEKCQRLDLKLNAPIHASPYFSTPLWSKAGDFVAMPFSSTVVVFNTATGEEVARHKATTVPVSGVALSPNGSRVFMVHADGRIKFHDSEESRPFEGHTSRTRSRVYWTEDGKRVFSAGRNGELIVVDVEQSKTIDVFKIPYPSDSAWNRINQIQFSKDGELLMIAGPSMVSFWKSRTGKPIISPEGHFRNDETYELEKRTGKSRNVVHGVGQQAASNNRRADSTR